MSNRTSRVVCKFDDLVEAWIEVPDRGWTLARVEEISSKRHEAAEAVALVHRYVTACHLPILEDEPETEQGGPKPTGPITNPTDLTTEILRYYMDMRFLNFLVSAIYEGAMDMFKLAPFAVQVLSDPSEIAKPANPPS